MDVGARTEEEGCTTPKRRECRIPAISTCPPPPPKKKSTTGRILLLTLCSQYLLLTRDPWVSGSEEGCTTPKRRECRIPAILTCPPPPKKKSTIGRIREPPKKGYFQPPALDALFAVFAS